MEQKTKYCPFCQTNHPRTHEFYARQGEYLDSKCRLHRRDIAKKHYQKNRESILARKAAQYPERYIKAKVSRYMRSRSIT